ncbi:hypothetical protein [Sphingomonas lycopersici]|uniref:Tetratricopeptide repeat protein n=1 Tax=Sphingomonas lycopersici TaxID=2951807 RepID=A0AA41ZDD9_9SPHN|nr:hypothetical protein [Sphingomonas lycopersici]MCW6537282.1 hypothetical protein [Sphingomonas lycopersici]
MAIGTVAVGGYAVAFSMAQVVVKTDPALAFRLASYDGRLAAAQAAALQRMAVTSGKGLPAGWLAAKALRQDPTAVAAVMVLAVEAELRRDQARARRNLRYAQKLSRRDVSMQLWSIETAVAAGDVSGALKWYDITLRTDPAMSETLFPVLAAATAEVPIREQLMHTLAGNPQWGGQFMRYLAVHSADPRIPAALFTALHKVKVGVPEDARTDTINRLIARGELDDAWSFYALDRSGASRSRSRDPGFIAELETPSSLDWVPINDNGTTTLIQDGALEFSAAAAVGGPLLRQTQLLAPGDYQLIGRSADVDQSEDSRPYWTLTCLDGRETGRVALPNSPGSSASFSGIFRVPDRSCKVQILTLIGRPSDRVEGLSGRIERAELAPAR